MNHQERTDAQNPEQLIARSPVPSQAEMEFRIDRVWERLDSEIRSQSSEDLIDDPASEKEWPNPVKWPLLRPVVVLACAVFAIAAAWFGMARRFVTNRNVYATVDRQGGRSYRVAADQIVAADISTPLMVTLRDGTRVEMRPQSELAVEAAADGLRVRLNSGNIIVTAAKQRRGHLYVQTRDITVSVVGTVFLVNADKEGSRVAVIEGEVRVQRGSIEEKLLPGQQLATNPAMEKSHVTGAGVQNQNSEVPPISQQSDEILPAVTQKTPETFEELVAKLQQVKRVVASLQELQRSVAKPQQSPAAAAAPPSRGISETFEAVSIKPSPLSAPPPNVPNARTGGFGVPPTITCLANAPNFQMQIDPKRFNVLRVSLHALIAAAYGVDCTLPEAISAEPDWVKSTPFEVQAVITTGPYNLTRHDVLAENDSPFQRMLQNMLSERFNLQLRKETKEVAGFQLVVAKAGTWDCHMPKTCRGLRLSENQDPEGAPVDPEGRTATFYTTLAPHTSISHWASTVVESNVGRPVIDKTGLSGFYDIRLEYPMTSEMKTLEDLTRMRTEVNETFLATIQEQLGFKLQSAKVPTTLLTIEHAEKPTPN